MGRAPGAGRKPKPTEQKRAAGNPGGRELNDNEPKFTEVNYQEPPEWLGAYGSALWFVLFDELMGQKVLKVTDIQNLELYCAAYQRFRAAEVALEFYGPLVPTPQGGLAKNPAATLVNEATRQMATIGALLGLDPSSRQRIKVPAAPGSDPFAALLGGSNGGH